MSDSSASPASGRGRVVREATAALGVFLGLVFVGVEIRANTAAIQGATLQGISDQSTNLQMQFATDPDLVRLMPQIIGDSIGPSDLGEEDQYRVLVAYLSIIRVAENRFQQTELGTVPQEGLEQFGGGSVLYTTPYLRALWPLLRGNFASDFLEHFEAQYRLNSRGRTSAASSA